MRHMYIRCILALIWLIAAIITCVSGNWAMTGLYAVMCGVFAYSAYAIWKKETDKGEK